MRGFLVARGFEVREVIARLEELGGAKIVELAGKAENISFPLPKALQGD